MKAEEAVQLMTKSYLHRVIDSFTKDLPKGDEEKSRNLILKNLDELTDPDRIVTVLGFEGIYSDQILLRGILEALVNAPDYMLKEEAIVDAVVEDQRSTITNAEAPDCLKYESTTAVEVFRAVLEVALDDDELSSEELRLIHKLREKVGLSERAKRLILAQMNHYPRAGNLVHSHSDFKDGLIDLQRRGVVMYCNKLDGGVFLVPEEMVVAIRNALDIELSVAAWSQLLDSLGGAHLSIILEAIGLPKSGTKEQKRDRIIAVGIQPSAALNTLSNQDLYDVCSSLPGAKVSGTKPERLDRIIDYFANLVRKEVSSEATPGERYYQYYSQLAARDRESLLANKVIKKDIDMERAFEEGTRFLFTEKLGLTLIDFPGSDHPDGAFQFRRSDDILMWDNKSKETQYDFPPSHVKQFKRYIRDSARRVSCFMVIVPTIDEDKCEENALRLKVESGQDTDIALIEAEDLVWVAEHWKEYERKGGFDPEVFNHTGILSRKVLTQRMKLFL